MTFKFLKIHVLGIWHSDFEMKIDEKRRSSIYFDRSFIIYARTGY